MLGKHSTTELRLQPFIFAILRWSLSVWPRLALKLSILLLQTSECWDYSYALPHSAYVWSMMFGVHLDCEMAKSG
jgi:hypothetical protein